ncbi:MAG: 4,5-DOPA dioxygenase extradiol [Steroidobacteraceae bacterium]|nr:4,5-DOPA dioxygenase extradiol [Steroidobacteraceae bacterium]
MRMPALFVGHGNPMNAIERNEYFRGWQDIARRLPKPVAILCVSAHWETQGAWVTASAHPPTIHDFYGFPKALFDVRYPAPGAPWLAERVAALVTSERVQQDPARGLDHGAWSVLVAMYPAADIPVVQLGMDTGRPGPHHYAIGRQLAPLRDQDVLVLASGNMVHNLGLFRFHDPKPQAWAEACDEELQRRISAGDHAALMDPGSLGPDMRLAVPTPEHYYPLLYALALQQEGEPLVFFNAGVIGSLSMTSVLIGGGLQA